MRTNTSVIGKMYNYTSPDGDTYKRYIASNDLFMYDIQGENARDLDNEAEQRLIDRLCYNLFDNDTCDSIL